MKLTLFIESDFLICLLFDIIFRFTSICPHITENIVFNALKPIPFNSTYAKLLKKKINKQTENKPCYRPSASDHLTLVNQHSIFY